MSGRVTRPPDPDELPSLRQRSPAVWWVAVIAVVGLVATTAAGLVGAIIG